MMNLIKTIGQLSEENLILLKKSLFAGVALYVVLLAIHDLLPYAIVISIGLFIFKSIKKEIS